MNALAHTTELAIINDEHNKRLRQMRERLIDDIFTEVRCLNKKGYTLTLALHESFLTVYVHNAAEIITSLNASYDNEDALISALTELEQIGTPKPTTEVVYDVEEEIYEEDTTDAETV